MMTEEDLKLKREEWEALTPASLKERNLCHEAMCRAFYELQGCFFAAARSEYTEFTDIRNKLSDLIQIDQEFITKDG